MKKNRINRVAALVMAVLPVVAVADFTQGKTAMMAGDYRTAMVEFKPLADSGDVKSQYIMGILYDDGLGGSS